MKSISNIEFSLTNRGLHQFARRIHDAKMPAAPVEPFNLSVHRIPSVKLVAAGVSLNFLSVNNLQELAPVQETLSRNRYASHATSPEAIAKEPIMTQST
ncbi:MAG: hypothetical protein Q8O52_13585 [Sulfuritalea sp.]|nr:hypothetical protein [Sulfuritalea sp.]